MAIKKYTITYNSQALIHKEELPEVSPGISLILLQFEASGEVSLKSKYPGIIFHLHRSNYGVTISSNNVIPILPFEVFLFASSSTSFKIIPVELYEKIGILIFSPRAIRNFYLHCASMHPHKIKFSKMLKNSKKVAIKEWLQECLWRYVFEATTPCFNISGMKNMIGLEIIKEIFFALLVDENLHPKDEFYPSGWERSNMPITLQKAIVFIEKNPVDKLSITAICKNSGTSPATLLRIFRKHLQTTPQKFLVKRKMFLAHELLRSSMRSILEIAELLGFSHPSAFISAFKKQFGMSPHHFRLTFRK